MRLHKLLFSLLCVFSCLSLVFSSMSLNVSADTYYTRLSWSSFSSMIGNTVQGYYLADNGNLKPVTLVKHDNSTQYITSVSMDETFAPNANLLAPNSYVCWYKCAIPADLYVNSESYLPFFQVDWNVHFSNVSYFGCETFCYNKVVYTTLNRDYLAQYNTFIAGNSAASVHALPFAFGSSTLAGRTYVSNKSESWGDYFGGIWAFYEGTATDYYIGSATYSNVFYDKYNDYIYFGLSCPVINPEYQFVDNSAPPSSGGGDTPAPDSGLSSGTVSGTVSDNGDGTQDIHVTVETDNTGLIGGILSGIKNLFVPSDDAISDFSDDVQDEFVDHLGGVSEVIDLLDEQGDYLRNAVATDTIYVGQIRAPVGGDEYFEFGGWDVELKPEYDSLHVLYDALPFVIDLIAVFAVLNMLRTKFDILLNPEGECITYDS